MGLIYVKFMGLIISKSCLGTDSCFIQEVTELALQV